MGTFFLQYCSRNNLQQQSSFKPIYNYEGEEENEFDEMISDQSPLSASMKYRLNLLCGDKVSGFVKCTIFLIALIGIVQPLLAGIETFPN